MITRQTRIESINQRLANLTDHELALVDNIVSGVTDSDKKQLMSQLSELVNAVEDIRTDAKEEGEELGASDD